MEWGCFAGDTVGYLFRIQGTLNQHGYHSILQRYAIPSGLDLVPLSFTFNRTSSLEGVPTYAEHLLPAFPILCGLTHPKPSQLVGGWVIVKAKSTDAALCQSSSSWLNSPYTAWRCVESLSC